MDVFIMYVLMIIDLTWTLVYHEEAGELNPLYEKLLTNNEPGFVYLKLALNTFAAFTVIYLRHKKPLLSRILAIFGIIIYSVVIFLHWQVLSDLNKVKALESADILDSSVKIISFFTS